jgi:hypothetical protein
MCRQDLFGSLADQGLCKVTPGSLLIGVAFQAMQSGTMGTLESAICCSTPNLSGVYALKKEWQNTSHTKANWCTYTISSSMQQGRATTANIVVKTQSQWVAAAVNKVNLVGLDKYMHQLQCHNRLYPMQVWHQFFAQFDADNAHDVPIIACYDNFV